MQNLRAAVRIVLFVASTLGLYGLWFVARIFIPNKTFWRQTIFSWWVRSFGWIANMRVEVEGPPPQPPFFLVTNHLGYADVAALRIAVNGVFVAKSDIKDWFLAGRIVRDMGIIFIDRAKRRDIPRAGEKILERLENGEGVFVFPEGTSTAGREILPFRSSFLQFAAEGDVPVSYAAITFETMPGSPPASDVVAWHDDISFVAHVWRLFKEPGFVARIRFGAKPLVVHDRKELAKQLHARISDLFVPLS
jgi:1-acyl-sn-glycerol-3-phosphate acyltransferase